VPRPYQLTREKLSALQLYHSEEKITAVKLLPENRATLSYPNAQVQR